MVRKSEYTTDTGAHAAVSTHMEDGGQAVSHAGVSHSGGQHAEAVSLRGLMSDLAQNTGMHGVPNIQRSPNLYRKLLWLIVVLGGVGMMAWKVSEAIVKYYQRPVETKISYYFNPHLDFPAVTVCNLNPIRKSAMEDWSDSNQYGEAGSELAEFFSSSEASNGNPFANRTDQGPGQTVSEDDDGYYEDERPEYTSVENYMASFAQMDYIDRFDLGHQIEDMLLDCSFNGKRCGPRNFTWFNNFQYGNCFTFNHANQSLSTTKVGPLYGLVLELFVEQDEYQYVVAPAAGFRVAIHNQTEMPFPEDQGFSIMPGTLTSVGIRKVVFKRASAPYGQCDTFSDERNAEVNGFLYQLDSVKYTTAACKKTCYQKSLLANCECFDSKYPFDQNITAYSNFTDRWYWPCADDSQPNTTAKCVDDTETKYKNDKLHCSKACPVECESTIYQRFSSVAMYPSNAAKDDVLDTLIDHSDALYERLVVWEEDVRDTYVRENVAKLEIYFEDLNYELIETSPSYLSLSLLSDLGGQAGLWLGLSIIALFEVFELLVDVGQVLYMKYAKAKHKGRVSDSQSSLTHGESADKRPDTGKSAFHLSMTSRAPSHVS